jgi:hypothetical protein
LPTTASSVWLWQLTRGNNHDADDEEEEVAQYTELDLELSDEDVATEKPQRKNRHQKMSKKMAMIL